MCMRLALIGGGGHQSVLSWIGWLCDSLGRAGSSCCHMMQHLQRSLLSPTVTLLLVPCQPHTQGVAGARRGDESGEPVATHKNSFARVCRSRARRRAQRTCRYTQRPCRQGFAVAGRGGERGGPVAIHNDPVVKGLLWRGTAASPEDPLLYTEPSCKGMLWQGAAISPDNLSLYERWAGVGGAGGAHVELRGKGAGDGARLLGDSGTRAG